MVSSSRATSSRTPSRHRPLPFLHRDTGREGARREPEGSGQKEKNPYLRVFTISVWDTTWSRSVGLYFSTQGRCDRSDSLRQPNMR